MTLLGIIFLLSIINCIEVVSRPLGSNCQLEFDIVNQLLMKTVEEKTFSVEPVIGVAVGDKGDAAVEDVIHLIEEKHPDSNYTQAQLRECMARYLATLPEPPLSGQSTSGGVLGYLRPHYLGGLTPLPVPIPEDENYLPGKEGYTSYLNPYEFSKKFPEYKPSGSHHQEETDEDESWDGFFDLFGGGSSEEQQTEKPDQGVTHGPPANQTSSGETNDLDWLINFVK